MPVSTRARPCTPDRPIRQEADTQKKREFYRYYVDHVGYLPMTQIARDCNTTTTTAYRWLKLRDDYGSPSTRRTRKFAKRLGKQSSLSDKTCKILVSPSRNPVRDQTYEA